jgi:hypothetical protein
MHSRSLFLAAALCALAPAAHAQMAPDRGALLAGFAGLESSLSEAARLGAFAALPGLPEDVRASAAARYETAAVTMADRIEAMQAMTLDNAAGQAVDSVSTRWEVLGREGATLIREADGDETHANALLRWVEGVEGLDEILDLIIDDIVSGQTIEG